MARLGDVCIINPKVPPIDDSMLVSFVPMQRVGEEGEFDPSEQRTYADVKKGFTYFADADVLFAKITPCMENGKGAIACGMENGIGFGSTEFHVLRPNKKMMMGEWLYYLTVCPTFRKEAERNMTGSAGQKRVPKSFLENYHVNIPVLSEQHQQVQVLNNIFALLSLRKQQLAKLDELVKSRFVELFSSVENEDTLANLCTFIDYRGKTPEKTESGLPFITAKNIKMHHMSFDTQEFISKETYDKVMTRGFPRIGDVVFTTEAPLGNVCRIPYIETEFYIGQRIITMQTELLEPAYLEYALSSDDFKRKIAEKSSGSTVTGIRSKLLEQLTIPVPPRALQEQFASFVKQTDKSKLAVQQSIDQLETLKKSLMQKYFG